MNGSLGESTAPAENRRSDTIERPIVSNVPTEFECVEVPRDLQDLVRFLCDDVWPFHGRCRLLDLGDIGDGAPQFDLRIASPHRGRGIGTRASRWIVDHLFTTHPELHRIEANTRGDNAAMQQALSATGFAHEGRLRDGWRSPDGQWFDTFVYGMLRSEWSTSRP